MPRCAIVLTIDGLVIVNLHMCGGRYDDPMFQDEKETKKEQILAVIQAIGRNSDLIIGDFNSEADPQLAINSLAEYGLYKSLSAS